MLPLSSEYVRQYVVTVLLHTYLYICILLIMLAFVPSALAIRVLI